jgi:hypothetical protein
VRAGGEWADLRVPSSLLRRRGGRMERKHETDGHKGRKKKRKALIKADSKIPDSHTTSMGISGQI